MAEDQVEPERRADSRIEKVREALVGQVEGVENLPAEGAAIVAFNHLSGLDVLLTHLGSTRRITFTSGREPDHQGMRAWLGRRLRGGDAAPLDAAAAGLRVLDRGDLLGIFPEGQRSPDGRLYRAHPLVARIALAAGVPVVPAALVLEQGRLRASRLVFGAPLDLSRFGGSLTPELSLQAAADTVMAAIRELSGQEYVDLHSAEARVLREDERRRDQELARTRAAAEKAARAEAQARARLEAAREAAELARAQAEAVAAAREQARRAAQADEARLRALSEARLPSQAPGQGRDPREPRTIEPHEPTS